MQTRPGYYRSGFTGVGSSLVTRNVRRKGATLIVTTYKQEAQLSLTNPRDASAASRGLSKNEKA